MPANDLIFQNSFEYAAVGMAHLSLTGAWLRVNRKLCEITGYSAEELMALGFQGITHHDDLARDVARLDELLSRNFTAYEAEKRYVRKDGSVIWVELHVSLVLDAVGQPTYGISVIQEISARKKAELEIAVTYQRYMALFEQMPEGVLLIDSELRIIGHNREAELQLLYSAEKLRTLHIFDIEAMDDMEAIATRRKRLEAIGRDDFESIYRKGTGELMDVDVSVKLIHLLDGLTMADGADANISYLQIGTGAGSGPGCSVPVATVPAYVDNLNTLKYVVPGNTNFKRAIGIATVADLPGAAEITEACLLDSTNTPIPGSYQTFSAIHKAAGAPVAVGYYIQEP